MIDRPQPIRKPQFATAKLMNIKCFSVLLVLILAVSGASAQGDAKKEKKKKNKSAPELKVVEIEDVPPAVEVAPPAPKPNNGSLYTDSAANGSLLSDFKARRVGDLVFVEIVEESEATVESSAARKRDSGNLGGIVPLANSLPVSGAATAGTVLGELGRRKYEGNGTTERSSKLAERITARVTQVLPNGDLRIQAVKLVRINRETEQVAVSGIVRQTDLDKDNSIETIFIGDLRVEINGKGVASADNAPGWLFRFFDKISPF